MDNETVIIKGLLSIVDLTVMLYFITAVPYRLFVRLRKRMRGEYVVPTTQVIIKILKSWLVAAPILMAVSSILVYISLSRMVGIDNDTIIQYIFAYAVLGNVLTSLMYGIAYTLYTTRKSV